MSFVHRKNTNLGLEENGLFSPVFTAACENAQFWLALKKPMLCSCVTWLSSDRVRERAELWEVVLGRGGFRLRFHFGADFPKTQSEVEWQASYRLETCFAVRKHHLGLFCNTYAPLMKLCERAHCPKVQCFHFDDDKASLCPS